MKVLVIAFLLALSGTALAEDAALDQCVGDPSHATYRMFQTQNVWTFLKLDTRTGLVWQVQWGNPHLQLPVNSVTFAQKQDSNAGRFILCPTKNIFNFLLLDQTDGRMWAVQWSQEEKTRSTAPLFFVDPAETVR